MKRRPSLLHDLKLRGDDNSYNDLLNKPIDKDNRIGDSRAALICAVIAAMWDEDGQLKEPNASRLRLASSGAGRLDLGSYLILRGGIAPLLG
ncbi:MAG: hypothetical protein EBX66_06235 [Betaproteobacteria bacterium]|nr:hypothetical protein [Betaproteobacteria bacterium]